MLKDHDEIEIGKICNYYGSLSVKVENGVPYWSIENWDGHYWEQITIGLYHSLIEFNESRV